MGYACTMINKTAFIFPGQGVQAVGMGADLARDFPVARMVFDEVDETLHQKLSHLMFEGDLETLTETHNAQPAIMAVSVAAFRVLQSETGVVPDMVAGHSLGEYSALCVADVLGLSDTAKLLSLRGQAMARACDQNSGGMVALLGATPAQAEELATANGCYVSNDNAPGQIVLSGTITNLEKAKSHAVKMGIKRVVLLPVNGAFHSPLMQSAADEMHAILSSIKFNPAKVPVYFNVTADIDVECAHYADLLQRQIVAPVRWRELVQNMNATRVVECGPGTVLSGLVRRILPQAETCAVGTTADVNLFQNGKV